MKRIEPPPSVEELCRTLLEKLRWPKGIRCPKCEGNSILRVTGGAGDRLACRCRHKFTVKSGTALHDSPLPLSVWCQAVLLLCRNPRMSAAALGRELRISYKTAWTLRGKISTLCDTATLCESESYFEDTLRCLLESGPVSFRDLVGS
jgi:transposase-like protein